MWIAIAVAAALGALLVTYWGWVQCHILRRHSFRFSAPTELVDGFWWKARCTRCPEGGDLILRCDHPSDKDRLFVYCPVKDHPMSPRYCESSPHQQQCVECPHKAVASFAEPT